MAVWSLEEKMEVSKDVEKQDRLGFCPLVYKG